MAASMTVKTYLDYNATCPIRPKVIDAVTDIMHIVGNPSSVHDAGRKARAIVEEARTKVAALAGSRARDVIFTASGTEANNMVVRGSGAKSLIVSAIEHDCVLASAKESGLPLMKVDVTKDGIIDLADLEQKLKVSEAPALVSIMLANNETGTLQPVAETAKLAKQYGALLHTDAVQAAGKVLIDQKLVGADYITLSAHKLGGPQGIGAVVTSPTAPLKALMVGGGQELGRRSGTENVAGIAGFGVASIEALTGLSNMDDIKGLRDYLENEVIALAGEQAIVARSAPRLPNTSCLLLPGVKGETQVMHYDLADVCVSSGSACSSGKVKVSHVLGAMGYDYSEADCSIRVSLGYLSTREDVDRFLTAWKKLYERTKVRGQAS